MLQNGRPDEALAIVPEGWSTRTFFALADNRKLVLRGIEPEQEELEDVCHRLVGATAGTTTASGPVVLSAAGQLTRSEDNRGH